MPRFSVIVPLYNKEKHVRRTLESILAQTYTDFEVIVVDDGSTDGGRAVVEAMPDDRIHLVRQANQGESVARNTGIMQAAGEIVSFLDADDEWDNGYLQTISRLITTYPGAGLYCTHYRIVEPDKSYEARIRGLPDGFRDGPLPGFFRSIALGNSPVFIGAVSIPRHVFESTGYFTPGVRLYADLEFWTRIALRHTIIFSTEIHAVYHKDAINRVCVNVVPTAEDLPFKQAILSAIESGKLSGPDADYAVQFINKYQLMNAFKLLISGHGKEARSLALSAGHDIYLLPRKLLVIVMSCLPEAAVTCLWRTGRVLKNLAVER